MKVRGQRECKDCGARWSYYETGSVECPDCGSLRSVGVEEERNLHTDTPVEFDLTEVREDVDARPLREVADRAGDLAAEYVRKRGFVRGGDLRPLDDTYLAAQELRHAADVVGRGLDLSDDEEWYFLALLRGADAGGESASATDADSPTETGPDRRPAPDEVPKSMQPIRGLAYADAVAEYRREMADWVDEQGESGEPGVRAQARDALETLGDHVKRVQALDGDVNAANAELLVSATRDVSRYLREGDDDALVSARDRFGRLAE
ncbi:TFIIB-type zinc ribbon-containing protein [Halorussus gelatinilyticus]|uniref:TFIIB-type zinc ribbon-containing protein n=1 Tax=Halorussus gelatinilyticus TaxID=2937524 RepID=A0A8U0IIT5_9EURY|nr:TFIIB-type zinc ribbon-containing protein [Halorussus gelatinilyticus]UPW00606.1 TFIIB-type zinc ribbon-containing protein [Halorussus gelatinilyticus]